MRVRVRIRVRAKVRARVRVSEAIAGPKKRRNKGQSGRGVPTAEFA